MSTHGNDCKIYSQEHYCNCGLVAAQQSIGAGVTQEGAKQLAILGAQQDSRIEAFKRKEKSALIAALKDLRESVEKLVTQLQD